jgi:hypothetical protein
MAGRPIDEKIVAMKMDNSDFKKKAVETTGLFGKLTSVLNKIPGVNLGKTATELNNIQTAANKTNMSGLTKSIDTISSRFTALGVIGTTALANIANRAVDTGLTMMRNLSVAPIMDGFREYELKMGSIQTILANTQRQGTTLEDVNREFGELNEYADKTIYNFGDMTRNIGLFTNAGLELEESVSMIKGFSNAAAASGSNAEQAARAAYQLSQGLSQGYLMQMDWMSLTNAGMGNDNMKRDLIALGQAYGTLNEDTESAVKNWKANLSEKQWLTSDVMSTYLQAMAGDLDKATLMTKGLSEEQANVLLQNAEIGEQSATYIRTFTQMMDALKEEIGSGWAESFEIIFGDFEEATKLWTGISEAITPFFAKQTEARNKALRAIFDNGGLAKIGAGIKNIFRPIGQIFSAIGDGFRKAFPPVSLNVLRGVADRFKDLTSGMEFSEKTVKNLSNIFSGFFSIFAIGWKIIKAAVGLIFEIIPSFEGLGSKILELISKVANIPINFNEAVDSTSMLSSAMDFLKTVASGVADGLENVVDVLISFAESMGEVWSVLTTGELTDNGPWEKDSKLVKWLQGVREGFKAITEYISSIQWSLEPVINAFSKFFGFIGDGFKWLMDKFSGIGSAIKDNMPSGSQLLQGGFVAILAGVAGFFMKLQWDIKQALLGWASIGEGVSDVLGGVASSLNAFALSIHAKSLLTIAIAVGILALALWGLSKLDGVDIAKGLYAIMGGLAAIVASLITLSKFDLTTTGSMGIALQIIALSIAFSILAGALKKVSDMNWEEISKGIVGLAGVMGAFAGAVVLMSKFGGPKVGASALQMIAMAAAVHILLSAVKKIAEIDTEVLKKGMLYLGIILTEIGLFLKLAGGTGFGVGASLGVLAVANAIKHMTSSVEKLGEMDIEVLKQGLTSIGWMLVYVAGFAAVTGQTGLLSASVGLMMVSGALTAMIVPVAALGSMDLDTLAKGLGAIGLILAAIGVAATQTKNMAAMGAGLMVVAAALHMFIVPIAALGSMELKTLAVGIGAMLTVLGSLAYLAIKITPAIPPMIGLGVAIGLLGVAGLAAGAGMALFSMGLLSLAGTSAASVAAIVATFTTLLMGIASILPTVVELVIKTVVEIAKAIATNAPTLIGEVLKMLIGIGEKIIEYGPKLIDTLLRIVLELLTTLKNRLPEFIDVGVGIVVGLMQGIGKNAVKIVDEGVKLIINLIVGMAEALKNNGDQIIQAFLALMGEVIILVIQSGAQLIEKLFGWIPGVTGAMEKVGNTAEDAIRESFGIVDVAESEGEAFVEEMYSWEEGVDGAATYIGKSAAEALADVDVKGVGADLGAGFALGIQSKEKDVADAANQLAWITRQKLNKELLIHSPSRMTMEMGAFVSEGLAIGIMDKAKQVGDSAKRLAGTAKDSLNKFLNGFELPEDDNELHFKAIIDYESLDVDRFGRLDPLRFKPNLSSTNNLVTSTKAERRQNDRTMPKKDDWNRPITNDYKYNINVTANGPMTKQAMRQLAEDIQSEIKNTNDRGRISRGEEVAF